MRPKFRSTFPDLTGLFAGSAGAPHGLPGDQHMGACTLKKNKDASKAMARELEVNPNAVATLLSATQLVIGRPEVRLSQRHATCVRTTLHGIPPIRLPPSRPAEAA